MIHTEGHKQKHKIKKQERQQKKNGQKSRIFDFQICKHILKQIIDKLKKYTVWYKRCGVVLNYAALLLLFFFLIIK